MPPNPDPSELPLTSSGESPYSAPVNDSDSFAEAAIRQCMEFDPVIANQMADACQGSKKGTADKSSEGYLPPISLVESYGTPPKSSTGAIRGSANLIMPSSMLPEVNSVYSDTVLTAAEPKTTGSVHAEPVIPAATYSSPGDIYSRFANVGSDGATPYSDTGNTLADRKPSSPIPSEPAVPPTPYSPPPDIASRFANVGPNGATPSPYSDTGNTLADRKPSSPSSLEPDAPSNPYSQPANVASRFDKPGIGVATPSPYSNTGITVADRKPSSPSSLEPDAPSNPYSQPANVASRFANVNANKIDSPDSANPDSGSKSTISTLANSADMPSAAGATKLNISPDLNSSLQIAKATTPGMPADSVRQQQISIAQNQPDSAVHSTTSPITDSTTNFPGVPALGRQALGIDADALVADTSRPNSPVINLPGTDSVIPTNTAPIADASNPSLLSNNQPSPAQLFDSMQRNLGLSRDANLTLNGIMLSAPSSVAGLSGGAQIFDAAGNPIAANNIGALSIKESGATYTAGAGPIANPGQQAQSVNGLTIKDGSVLANTSTSQTAAQALQGLLQQGQGGAVKLDESGKPILKGVGGPALVDGLITTTGKTGTAGSVDITQIGSLGLPGTIVTKGGKGGELINETALPLGQTGNATTTGIIITATAGATTTGTTTAGVAGAAGTGTATTTPGTKTPTTATGATTTTPGTKELAPTDIKALVGALPTLEIYDSKKDAGAKPDIPDRPEIDYDSIETNDFDDEDNDDFIDTPVVEGKRANSNVITNASKKPAKVGLSIIENIMVLLNDLKNQKVDDDTAQQMWADLFVDIFEQKKRQPYKVKAEDTLESIARYALKDARLAPLLYTINVHNKTIKPAKKADNIWSVGSIKPEAKTILLPRRSEILRYKIHVLKEKAPLMIYARSNKIDDGGFSTYVCRKGDTLKTIAASHADLLDINLWTEIALANGLSVRVTKNGNPVAKLKEGQVLKIPRGYIEAELEDEEELIDSPVKNEAMVAPALNIDVQDKAALTKTLASMEKRIISQSDLGSGTDSVLIKLELKHGHTQIKVAEWAVNETSSTFKLYDKFGGCKTVLVALPTRAARELAENDLKANGERYCRMFLTGEIAA